MKFSCCIPTWQPTRTEEASQRFWSALRSAEPFDEIIVALEANGFVDFAITKDLIKEVSPNAIVVEVPQDPTPIKERLSGGECYNRSVEPATGDFISLLADDDEYNVHNVKILLQNDERFKNEEIVYTPYYCLNAHNRMGVFMPPSEVQIETLLKCNYISNSAFISRKVWDELGGRRKDTVCDWDMWIRAKRAGKKFLFFPYPIYMQRFYEDSLFMRQKKVWGDKAIEEKIQEALK